MDGISLFLLLYTHSNWSFFIFYLTYSDNFSHLTYLRGNQYFHYNASISICSYRNRIAIDELHMLNLVRMHKLFYFFVINLINLNCASIFIKIMFFSNFLHTTILFVCSIIRTINTSITTCCHWNACIITACKFSKFTKKFYSILNYFTKLN